MFKSITEFFMSRLKKKVVVASPATSKKGGRKKSAVNIKLVTAAAVIEEPKAKKFKQLKKTCEKIEHDCLAIQLTNRLISVVLEFEINMKRIQDHPSLSVDTKSDISNYINKNIVTVLWALSPAFDLMVDYPRTKAFKAVYSKAFKAGVPGILQEIKHI